GLRIYFRCTPHHAVRLHGRRLSDGKRARRAFQCRHPRLLARHADDAETDQLSSMTGQHFTPREMLDRLVAFDTTSRDGNLPLIAFVEGYLASWDIPSLRVDYEPGKKTNLYATIGRQDKGGIVL